MQHNGSTTRSERLALMEAEDRGFDAGREIGFGEGADWMRAACITLLESHGHTLGAQRLREAKVVEKTE